MVIVNGLLCFSFGNCAIVAIKHLSYMGLAISGRWMRHHAETKQIIGWYLQSIEHVDALHWDDFLVHLTLQ